MGVKQRVDVQELRKALERTHPRDVAREYVERVPTDEGHVYFALAVPGARTVMCSDDPTDVIAHIIEKDREGRA